MKKILVLILTLALLCPCTALATETSPEVERSDKLITKITGISAEAGTPVLVLVVEKGPYDEEGMVSYLSDKTDLKALNVDVEGIVVGNTDDKGSVELNLKLRDNLPTASYYVLIKYLGSGGYICAGEFENVYKGDIDTLVGDLNDSDAENCATILNGDILYDGDTAGSKNEILRKNNADVVSYKSLGDKTVEFHKILYSLKGNAFENITDLVKKFNDAFVWTELCTASNTENVLKKQEYNGEGKYWNVPMDEGSDYATVTKDENEKNTILNKIKAAMFTGEEWYPDSVTLENAFKENVALALFRSLPQDREDLEELMADEEYASYFANARTIVENANLSTYDVTQLYNNVLAGCSLCTKFDAAESEGSVEKLFKDSIPTQSGSGGNDGDSEGDNVIDMGQGNSGISNGGSGGGGGGGIKKDPVKENEETEPSPSTALTPFADVSETHWANKYIAKLYNSGAINGVSETAFNPAGSVQRQDFVKILIGALGTKLSENKSQFSDVPGGAYYESYVMTALENGFISGTGDGSFGVGSNLKREDAAVIMARVLDSYGVKTLQLGKTFNDDAQVSDYAKDAIKKVSAIGIFGGDDLGNFNPKGSLTRAEACAILCRLADAVKEV